MLTVFATCQCGHTGHITDERAVKAFQDMKGFKGRCSQCGAQNRFTTVLGYVIEMEATRADSSSPAPGGQADKTK